MGTRVGIDKFSNGESYDLYGAKTFFRAISDSFVKKVVSSGKWFTFCTGVDDRQVDIMSIKNNSGESLGHFASELYPDTIYKSAVYKYLLRDYLCYYEAPSYVKDNYASEGFKLSYKKYLVTSSLRVVALWLGMSLEDVTAKYGYRLSEVWSDNECNEFQYVKLYVNKDGVRKVTVPRKDLDLFKSGTRVIPVYALDSGIKELYRVASKDYTNVVFLKDGGAVREINITFNTDKLRSIYDSSYVSENMGYVFDGVFADNPYLERGYIRVFEVGSSKYDSPLRCINFSRILSFNVGNPDLAYINIDLTGVMSVFRDCINNNMLDFHEIVNMLKEYEVGGENAFDGKDIYSPMDLISWAEGREVLLGTVFLRELALFMIGNPEWFDNYDGCKRESYTENSKTKSRTSKSDGNEVSSLEDLSLDELDF